MSDRSSKEDLETAAMVYGVKVEDVTPEQQRIGRNINFCRRYGILGDELLAEIASTPLNRKGK
jgi:DNA polymerase I-like protein with 3'-5' exonuclease and polymerase domains